MFLSETVGGFLSEMRGKFWKAPLLSPPPRALLAELAVRENEEEGEDEDDDEGEEEEEEEGLNTLSKLNPLEIVRFDCTFYCQRFHQKRR